MGVSGGDEVGAGEFRRYELSFFAAFTCYTVFPQMFVEMPKQTRALGHTLFWASYATNEVCC